MIYFIYLITFFQLIILSSCDSPNASTLNQGETNVSSFSVTNSTVSSSIANELPVDVSSQVVIEHSFTSAFQSSFTTEFESSSITVKIGDVFISSNSQTISSNVPPQIIIDSTNLQFVDSIIIVVDSIQSILFHGIDVEGGILQWDFSSTLGSVSDSQISYSYTLDKESIIFSANENFNTPLELVIALSDGESTTLKKIYLIFPKTELVGRLTPADTIRAVAQCIDNSQPNSYKWYLQMTPSSDKIIVKTSSDSDIYEIQNKDLEKYLSVVLSCSTYTEESTISNPISYEQDISIVWSSLISRNEDSSYEIYLQNNYYIPLIHTEDNGYFVVYRSKIEWVGSKYFINATKLNSYGEVEWKTLLSQFHLGKYVGRDVRISSVTNTNDGYVVSLIPDIQGEKKTLLYKLDFHGEIVWETTLESCEINAITATEDNKFVGVGIQELIVSGYKERYTYIAKFDTLGIIEWESKPIDADTRKRGTAVVTGHDEGYIVSGVDGFSECFLFKVDNTGNLLWQVDISTNSTFHSVPSITKTHDNGVVALISADGIRVVKVTSEGVIEWAHNIESPAVLPKQIVETSDRGFIINSTAYPKSEFTKYSNHDICLFKLNSNGTLAFHKPLGGTGTDYGSSIIRTGELEYVITGSTASEEISGDGFYGSIWLAKMLLEN